MAVPTAMAGAVPQVSVAVVGAAASAYVAPQAVRGRDLPPPARPDDKSLPIDLIARPSSPDPPAPDPFSVAQPPRGASRTQISGDAAARTASTHASGIPPVNVILAADVEPPKLVWWAAVLVALGCLALGVALGYLLGSG